MFTTIASVIATMQCLAAATWYVAASGGNDSNAGKTQAAALKTIQKAIDKSAAGDTILVGEGTYDHIVVPASKEPLIIRAVGSVSACVIKGRDGSTGYARCATLGSSATTNIVLSGFTLTGGCVNDYCDDRSGAGVKYGTVNNCVITKNRAGFLSSAAGASHCVLNDCEISDNTCSDWVGGIESCVASRCIIKNNSGYQGAGGASSSVLTNCVLQGNKSQYGGGGCGDSVLYSCVVENNKSTSTDHPTELNSGTAYNCIIVGGSSGSAQQYRLCWTKLYNCTIVELDSKMNHGSTAGEYYNCIIYVATGSYSWYFWPKDHRNAMLYNCCVNRGWLDYATTGALIQKSPGFVSSTDYRLKSTSPCVDKGNNSYAAGLQVDFGGNPRIVNGKVDIGAYEYQPSVGSVEKVAATPRYPWNGLVDLQFTIKGDSGVKFNTSFSAKDLVGNTNLTMKTIYKTDGTAANVAKEQLAPGTYNWVWDATADLGEGVVLDRVTVSVNVQ